MENNDDTNLGPQHLTTDMDNGTREPEKIISKSLSGLDIFFICSCCVIIPVGLIGNGLVIFVTGYKMKTTVNSIWFLNLAIADFLFLFAPISYIDFVVLGNWPNFIVCKLLFFFTEQNYFASILLLTAISLDRCVCTWFIVWARMKRTLVKARIICTMVWVLSICFSLAFIKTFCTFFLDVKSVALYRFTVGFLIPFLIIASSYIAIGVRIKRLKGGNQFRHFRVIISLILAFFICWFPFHIHQFCLISANENGWSENVHKRIQDATYFVRCLIFLNSCLNPILYVFMCDEYKKKLKQSLLLVLESAFAEEHLAIQVTRQINDTTTSTSTGCQTANITTL